MKKQKIIGILIITLLISSLLIYFIINKYSKSPAERLLECKIEAWKNCGMPYDESIPPEQWCYKLKGANAIGLEHCGEVPEENLFCWGVGLGICLEDGELE